MLKDNRGFSFVEMMTVCVILCAIVITAYPIVILTVKRSKENIYQDNVASLERLSLSWALEHVSLLPDDNSDARFITVAELEKEEYIKTSDIEDPRDNSKMDGCIKISKDQNEQYTSKYYEGTCEELGKEYVPKVKILKDGATTHEINADEKYQYPKLKATTVLGETIEIPKPTILCNKKKVKDLEHQKVGDTCQVIYNIQDPNNGLINKKVFDVSIVDTKAPVITVLGSTKGFDEEIPVLESYTIPTATVTDNSKETTTLTVSTNLNTSKTGSYEIIYRATDTSDNLGLLVIKVKVVDNKLLEENQIIVDNSLVLPGDGTLEKESTSEYIFKGANPNNYIRYQNELWRIIRLDNNGIKIIKNDPLQISNWSDKGSIGHTDSKVSSLLTNYQNTLTTPGIYKQARLNIGTIDIKNLLPIQALERNESSLKSDIGIGLPLVSDYLKASGASECLTSATNCQSQNYLTRSYTYFTSGTVKDNKTIVGIQNTGLVELKPSDSANIVPVIYLKGYKTLQGTGTINDPYWYN